MPQPKATYECPNPKCHHRDTREIDAPSKAAAWETASAPCPGHELFGEMQPV